MEYDLVTSGFPGLEELENNTVPNTDTTTLGAAAVVKADNTDINSIEERQSDMISHGGGGGSKILVFKNVPIHRNHLFNKRFSKSKIERGLMYKLCKCLEKAYGLAFQPGLEIQGVSFFGRTGFFRFLQSKRRTYYSWLVVKCASENVAQTILNTIEGSSCCRTNMLRVEPFRRKSTTVIGHKTDRPTMVNQNPFIYL